MDKIKSWNFEVLIGSGFSSSNIVVDCLAEPNVMSLVYFG